MFSVVGAVKKEIFTNTPGTAGGPVSQYRYIPVSQYRYIPVSQYRYIPVSHPQFIRRSNFFLNISRRRILPSVLYKSI